jgi:nitrilase
MKEPLQVACIQAESVAFDRDATIDKLAALTGEAAAGGAKLVVFPETFISGYPFSRWARTFAAWDDPRAREAFSLIASSALELPGPDFDRLGAIAWDAGVVLAVGATERDPERPGTLYNSLLVFGSDGQLLIHHRKLVPTNHERLIWGGGDGRGLRAVESPVGRLGGLVCWENYMPLARFALYESGLELYLAPTADDGDAWQSTLVHLARESRAFVISPCAFQRKASYPEGFPLRDELTDVLVGRGGSAILSPSGAYLAGPLRGEEGILTATLDPRLLDEERQRFDPAGHYHRPDVLSLSFTGNAD